MSNIHKPVLCPKCKGTGTGKYERNELGNLEADICNECGGVGWICPDAPTIDIPGKIEDMDFDPMSTSTYTTSNENSKPFDEETLREAIKEIEAIEGDTVQYSVIDHTTGKMYSVKKKDSMGTILLDTLLGKNKYNPYMENIKDTEARLVYTEGVEANKNGHSKFHNPYKENSDNYNNWNKGWDDTSSVSSTENYKDPNPEVDLHDEHI